MVATLHGQLLSGSRLTVIHGLLVALGEVVDAQVVDVGIVIDALVREIQTEIGAVGAKTLSQLGERQVVLPIDARFLTLLLKQSRYLFIVNIRGRTHLRLLAVRKRLREGLVGLQIAQVAQSIDAPRQIEHKHQTDEMEDIDKNRAFARQRIEHIDQHDDAQQCHTLPHLLVLQVGIVLAQPAAIAPRLANHIDKETNAQQQAIGIPQREIVATVDYAPCT